MALRCVANRNDIIAKPLGTGQNHIGLIKKNNILLILFLIVSLTSCKDNSQTDYSYEKIQIDRTDIFLTLPTGIDSSEIEDFTEGIFQQFKYTDKSIVVISTNGMGYIDMSGEKANKVIERKEVIDGIQIAYFITNKERRAEFDQAFNLMLESGLK